MSPGGPSWLLFLSLGLCALAFGALYFHSSRRRSRLGAELFAASREAESLSATLGALRAERDLMGGVLAAMREGVLVLDRAGRIAMVNPALREMLLLGAGVAGKSPIEAIRHAPLQELLERARQGQPALEEIELPGLRPRRLLVHASAQEGELGGALSVFVDVTEIRRLETLRRDFVANASHELRTPVTTIRTAAETLRRAGADPETSERFLEIIERNSARLQRLVEDLLDLSRLESRQYRLELEPLELSSVLAHAAASFRARAEQRRIGVHTAVPEGLPRAHADRRALEQVLSNLVENAVKYCPEGAHISLHASESEGLLRVQVEDNGPGIEGKHLPRLFERFYRVDAGRSRDLGGTGLGLAIVKHLVEAMGGRVSVESELGQGACFSFTLPKA